MKGGALQDGLELLLFWVYILFDHMSLLEIISGRNLDFFLDFQVAV